MGNAIPLRGARGVIRWHYYTAAGVTDFTVTYDQERRAWSLRGGAIAPDPFKLGQTPLEFFAPTKQGTGLRWPVITVTVKDGRIAATLGEPGTGTTTYESIRSA